MLDVVIDDLDKRIGICYGAVQEVERPMLGKDPGDSSDTPLAVDPGLGLG